MKICKVKNCEEKHYALGYCGKHYMRVLRHGSIYNKNRSGKNSSSYIHGMSKNRFFFRFNGILGRCNDKNSDSYSRYGAKGIKCEWKSFLDFKNDMYKSFLKHVKVYGEKNTQIDRINNSRGYYKENCRWVTLKEQQRNTSRNTIIKYKNKKKCLSEWSEILNMNYTTLCNRLNIRKWSVEKAFSTPVRKFIWQKK